ncbi:hypothetical protein IJ22_02630 [Paenibacillus naphthalenovorans]|uniref:Uncharacterized protein n=1 Tax=Paenibacillus naphthalenovorans TaxID=162209 RepID=A0A0U2UBU6_9BACL|nr:hypothetical protein IJ22_02630 [Paenibacillus naphthalenovorans]
MVRCSSLLFGFIKTILITCHQTTAYSIQWIVHEPKPAKQEVIPLRYGCSATKISRTPVTFIPSR